MVCIVAGFAVVYYKKTKSSNQEVEAQLTIVKEDENVTAAIKLDNSKLKEKLQEQHEVISNVASVIKEIISDNQALHKKIETQNTLIKDVIYLINGNKIDEINSISSLLKAIHGKNEKVMAKLKKATQDKYLKEVNDILKPHNLELDSKGMVVPLETKTTNEKTIYEHLREIDIFLGMHTPTLPNDVNIIEELGAVEEE